MICVTCKDEIAKGDERKWGKQFKCSSCMKAYNAAKTARNRDKQRGPDCTPKSTPRHFMLDCDNFGHICTGCNLKKTFSEFYKNEETPCGFDPRCKQCRHEARRARMGAVLEKPRSNSEEERKERLRLSAKKYREANPEKAAELNRIFKLTYFNISFDQFDWLAAQQNNVCFLCEEPEVRVDVRSGKVMRLSIDHDHRCCKTVGKSCGKCIRHLLCSMCNTLVGKVEAKPKLVHRFADYIDLRPLENYPGPGNW